MTLNRISITSVQFTRYKALSQYSLTLRDTNILVGPNNCGKSTVIGAFRALAVAIRSARVRKPDWVRVGGMDLRGYRIPEELLPISIENVHTDYADAPSSVLFCLSNGNSLKLYLPEDGGCLLVPETAGRVVTSAALFKQSFTLNVVVVPTLGPVEHREPLVEAATVRRNVETHRAPRHFRSYWYYNEGEFTAFAARVAETWPGMSLEEVRRDWQSNEVSLFCRDGRISRELYWAGSGFQIWYQLLTHIIRAENADLLVIDEPEIYLHPDVQRQLLVLLCHKSNLSQDDHTTGSEADM